MQRIILGLFIGTLCLSACGGASYQAQTAPVSVSNTFTSTSSPTPTRTSLPSATPTASITPLPTIPTPTFDRLIQPNPFPTHTPNPDEQALAQKWNSKNIRLSPDGQWATIVDFGILHIVQVNGDDELTINCKIFTRCEFIIPLQWSPDNQTLYVASLQTGESLITFTLNTGIGRINVKTGNFEKVVEDGVNEGDYSATLSPDGKHIAIADMRKNPPQLIILETATLQIKTKREINITLDSHGYGILGHLFWTNSLEGIVFVAQSPSSISSIIYFDLVTNTVTTLVDKDPSLIELLFINEINQVALSKTTYYPLSKSYWYLDINTKELFQILVP